MYNWMMMTGLAGMMAWIIPGCGAVALAQCRTPCGPAEGPGPREQAAQRTPEAEVAGRATGTIDPERSPLPRCPVMGDAVNFNIKSMTDDGPVYFCCEMCPPKFKKDPAKYADKLAEQRAALETRARVQVVCPVDGKTVDGKLTADVGAQKVAFCSKGCRSKYVEHPAAFKGRLADSYTYQTRCPVSGEPIDPSAFTDVNSGQRIYFCCADCSAKLLTAPAKYAPRLAEQGVTIDPKNLGGADASTRKEEHAGHNHP